MERRKTQIAIWDWDTQMLHSHWVGAVGDTLYLSSQSPFTCPFFRPQPQTLSTFYTSITFYPIQPSLHQTILPILSQFLSISSSSSSFQKTKCQKKEYFRLWRKTKKRLNKIEIDAISHFLAFVLKHFHMKVKENPSSYAANLIHARRTSFLTSLPFYYFMLPWKKCL